jgi:hypothetical protein
MYLKLGLASTLPAWSEISSTSKGWPEALLPTLRVHEEYVRRPQRQEPQHPSHRHHERHGDGHTQQLPMGSNQASDIHVDRGH